MKFFFVVIFLIITSGSASARVFSLNQGTVAPYFFGAWTSSVIGKDAYINSSGGASITEEVEYQYAGELGIFIPTEKVGIRVGVLGMYPQLIDNVSGRNTAGVKQFDLTSKIIGVLGVIHLEYNLISNQELRWYVSAGGGMGSVTILNSYTFSPGNVYGLSDFTEEGRAFTPMYEGAMGFEYVIFDNTSMFMDGGYRYMIAEDFKQQRDFNGFGGAVQSGQRVDNADGQMRKINLSSAYFGLGFKFYLN